MNDGTSACWLVDGWMRVVMICGHARWEMDEVCVWKMNDYRARN